MKIKLSNRDIIWSYIGTIMSMGANLLMLPFLMYYLDEDMLGLWYVFSSVGAIATLFDFGFAVTFARNITYCWSGARTLKKEDVEFVQNRKSDFRMMKNVLSTCKMIYGILSCVASVLLLSFGTLYIKFISREIEGITHIVAWIIFVIAAFLNLYYGYYASFLRGVGAVGRANKNTVIARAIQIILTVLLLYFGMGLVGASISYLAYGAIFRLLGKHYFYRYEHIDEKLSQITDRVSNAQIKELFFVVWHNAWRDGAISVCNYFCNQASTVICSMFLSLSQTGIYSIGVQIASAIAQIAGTLYTAYQPELQSAYVNSNNKKLRETMSLIVVSFVGLFILGTVAFVLLGIPILQLIKPDTIISIPVLLGLCVYQFLLKLRNCYTSYFSCTNRIIYMNGFIVSAVLCVLLSLVMVGGLKLGVWGLIFAQILSQLVYNVWHWPMLAHKELDLSIKDLIKTGIAEISDFIKRFLLV